LEKGLWVIAWVSIALMLLVEIRALHLRYLVNDDYQMLYTSWLRSLGKVPPRDFGIQSYHILPDLLDPLIRASTFRIESIYLARIPFLIALGAIPFVVTRLSRTLLPRPWLPFAAVASLASWPLLERGLDIRPDLFLGLLWILLLIRAAEPMRGFAHDMWTGALLAVAFVVRAKALLILPALGFLLLSAHVGLRPWHVDGKTLRLRVGGFLTGGTSVGLIFLIYLAITSQLQSFVLGNRILGRITQTGLQGFSIHQGAFLGLLSQDWPWLTLALLGVGWYLWEGRRSVAKRPHLATAVLLLCSVFLLGDPAFYTYNFLILLPLLSPFVAAACGCLAWKIKAPWSRRAGAWILLAALPLFHGQLLWRLATRPTNKHQIELAHAIEQTSPETVIFSLEGIGLFRPSTYDWRLSAVSTPLYMEGKIDLGDQLRKTRPEILILSYRVPGWFKPSEREWMVKNYVQVGPHMALLAAMVNPSAPRSSFSVPRQQTFWVIGPACKVDGLDRPSRTPFVLGPGEHHLESTGGASVVTYYWPSLPKVASNAIPYLFSPDQSLYLEVGF